MKMIRLGDIANIEISNVDKKSKDGEPEVRLCNFVDVYHNWAITKDMREIFMAATAKLSQLEKFSLKKGQVAITKDSETRDDIGIATYIADTMPNVVLGYHCILITPNESVINGKYLNAVFHTPYAQHYFEFNASGSGQRYTLTNEIVADFPIPIIDMDEQKQIGDLFSNIDMQIANNNSICSDLEAMAKQLYDYWFVQFDFPDENGKPYKSSGGKMVWNEELKREIPEGWSNCTIQDISKRVKVGFVGTVDKFYCDSLSGVPIVRPAEMGENGINFSDLRYVSYDFHKKNKKSQVHFGDVLISRCGKDGIPNIYDSNNEGQVLNAVMIEPDFSVASSSYIMECLKSLYSQVQIKNGTSGSVQGVVNTEMIANIKLPFSECICKLFDTKIAFIYEIISIMRKESQELKSLRDFLLPMLMNGQVKVGKEAPSC